MRILLINQVFFPDPPATSLYLTPVAEKLVAEGHQVTVLTSQRAYDDPNRRYPARETWHGIDIIRVWNTNLGRKAKWRRAVDFLSFLAMASLRGLLLPKADLVMALTTPPLISVLGAILAKLRGARFVFWVCDLFPDEAVAIGWFKPDGLATRFFEAASRWTLRQADHVIVQDRFVLERLKAKGVPGEKLEIIPLWIQGTAAFDAGKREQFRRTHGLENKYVVMFAGNHTPCHPLDTLVEAARLLREDMQDTRIHFCFVGFGIDWTKWRDRAHEEGWSNATFLGHQPLSSGVIAAADTQVVAMGDAFVGIVHACKIYNMMSARRPFIYLGPEPSHISDIIREGRLESVAASFRHGQSRAMAEELRRRADVLENEQPAWPPEEQIKRWSEAVNLEKMISAMVPKEIIGKN